MSESVVINNLNPEEEKSNQRIMSIRDKLKGRQAGDGEKKSWGGLITALLLTALLVVGIMLYFKIGSLANGITIEQAPQISQTPETYEYAIDFILDQNLTERMTQRGKASWQVVGSRRTQDSTSGQYGYEFIFMRKIRGN